MRFTITGTLKTCEVSYMVFSPCADWASGSALFPWRIVQMVAFCSSGIEVPHLSMEIYEKENIVFVVFWSDHTLSNDGNGRQQCGVLARGLRKQDHLWCILGWYDPDNSWQFSIASAPNEANRSVFKCLSSVAFRVMRWRWTQRIQIWLTVFRTLFWSGFHHSSSSYRLCFSSLTWESKSSDTPRDCLNKQKNQDQNKAQR